MRQVLIQEPADSMETFPEQMNTEIIFFTVLNSTDLHGYGFFVSPHLQIPSCCPACEGVIAVKREDFPACDRH